MGYVGRLAPSPTGLLHLGHARTFWIAYERALERGGQLLLRNEDLDPQRSKQHFVDAMREDLRWLGIEWVGELQQSARVRVYRAALRELMDAGYAYACTCSRRDLAQAVQAPHEDDDEPLYNNRCRPAVVGAGAAFEAGVNYRFRIATAEPVVFNDLHAGLQSFMPGKDFGDFLIWRKALTNSPDDIGLPSYQLACVVDDAAMRITEVVRGRDLLKSTARQMLLQRALGLATPQYFHADLMRDDAGVRLAKRHDALALRGLRERGLTPAEVRAMF
jgi:glutamyl/glutaminyl-tRNA synthetase